MEREKKDDNKGRCTRARAQDESVAHARASTVAGGSGGQTVVLGCLGSGSVGHAALLERFQLSSNRSTTAVDGCGCMC